MQTSFRHPGSPSAAAPTRKRLHQLAAAVLSALLATTALAAPAEVYPVRMPGYVNR